MCHQLAFFIFLTLLHHTIAVWNTVPADDARLNNLLREMAQASIQKYNRDHARHVDRLVLRWIVGGWEFISRAIIKYQVMFRAEDHHGASRTYKAEASWKFSQLILTRVSENNSEA